MNKTQQYLEWACQSPDATGECDRCHSETVGLWTLPSELDQEPDAGWMYCRKCFRALVSRNSMQSIDAEMERMMIGY